MSSTSFDWAAVFVASVSVLAAMLHCSPSSSGGARQSQEVLPASSRETTALPRPQRDGEVSLERAIDSRRSVRSFSTRALSLEQAGQLLWAAQGRPSGEDTRRTAPSAGATYPLETYLVSFAVTGLETGVYKYDPASHALTMVQRGDVRDGLLDAALRQRSIQTAAAMIVMTGVFDRTTQRYSDRGERYVHMEAGHAAQNAHLQASALGLGMVPIGAFHDAAVRQVLRLSTDEVPLYLLPVGRLEG